MNWRKLLIVGAGVFQITSFCAEPRKAVDHSTGAGKYLGKILKDGNHLCTGELIGPYHVMLATHCATPEERENSKFEFALHESFGKSTDTSPINKFIAPAPNKLAENTTAYDFMIANLEKPLGLKYGWMEVLPARAAIGTRVSALGYSSDFVLGASASIHEGCKVSAYQNPLIRFLDGPKWGSFGYIVVDCMFGKGASGGTISAEIKDLDLDSTVWGDEPLLVGVISSDGSLVERGPHAPRVAVSTGYFSPAILINSFITMSVEFSKLCREKQECEAAEQFQVQAWMGEVDSLAVALEKKGDDAAAIVGGILERRLRSKRPYEHTLAARRMKDALRSLWQKHYANDR